MPEIYQPAEDSYLLSDVLEKQIPELLKSNKELKVLEIGAGSGVQLKKLRELKVKNIFACDINPEAVKHCKKLNFNCKTSDLFSNIKEKYNIIIFNPPYLPKNPDEPEDSQTATTGGKIGSEIINKFLKQSKKHLNPGGKIFFLTSSLTQNINWNNYKKTKLAEKKLFFEKLIVWDLREN